MYYSPRGHFTNMTINESFSGGEILMDPFEARTWILA